MIKLNTHNLPGDCFQLILDVNGKESSYCYTMKDINIDDKESLALSLIPMISALIERTYKD